MKEIKAIVQPELLYAILLELRDIPGMPGLTVSDIRAFPRKHAHSQPDRDTMGSFEVAKIECVVNDNLASAVVEAIAKAAHTGNPGDGKIYIYEVQEVVQIRTGKRGKEAI